QLENAAGHVEVLPLFAADVVDLPRASFAEDEFHSSRVVAGVKPLPALPAVAVDGERLAVERVRHEEGDQLLRVLEGAVSVGPARDAGVDAEGPHCSQDLEIA